MSAKAYRLPGTVRPRSYEIHLHAQVEEEAFTGHVRIALETNREVDVIELHAREIDITDAKLHTSGEALALRVEDHAASEMLRFRLPRAIPAGKHTLEITYAGKVSRNMDGLYLSKDGEEAVLATQCEETDARAIFPCFDEPAYKATFAWTITTKDDVTVLANGPLIDKTDNANGTRTWRFEATKPMSSYLVAVVIGRIASTPEHIVEGVPMRVWAMQGKENLGRFSDDFAARLLPWYNDYFGVPYHFGKYDQVAVPSFSAGAMENSGLVLFRQALLLHDAKSTSWRQERLIARVVAHEFAHMWFGNLVTMAWWDDIWLNEAFAEWMAHKATDAIAPEYEIWDDFSSEKAAALGMDALASTHAIYTPVETPEQATELFDKITYSKGAAVMRMLENFLGEDAFRAGLRTYMKEFSEKNAAGSDLWRHLGEASKKPVEDLMQSWISQPGHPILRATLTEGDSGTHIHLQQRRFFSAKDAPASEQTWHIPVVLRHADQWGVHETRFIMTQPETTIALEGGGLKWLHANAEATGFYRQDLDDVLLDKLLTNAHELVPASQAGLLDDQWGLVRAGEQPITRFLDVLARTMRVATAPSAIERAAHYLGRIDDLLADAGDDAAHAAFRAWAGAALRPKLDAIGLSARPEEPKQAAEQRRILFEALGSIAEDAEVNRFAVELADREAADSQRVDPELAGSVVWLAARGGDDARLDRHVRIYNERRAAKASPSETNRYLQSFAAFRGDALIHRVLGLLSDGSLPLEAIGPLLRTMLGRRETREHAWEHMTAHWKDVRERLGDMWTGALVDATGNLPPARRDEMVRFYDANLGEVAQQSYKRALESIDQRAEFEARTMAPLVAWFRPK